MRATILATLISLVLTGDACGSPGVQRAARSAVYVESDGSRGAGVVVAVSSIPPRTLVLTACHVVDDAARITCTFAPGGIEYPARLLATSPRDDLAILDVPHAPAGVQAAELVLAVPAQGDEVMTIGTPRGLDFFCRWGHVAMQGVRRVTSGPQCYLVLDMPGEFGMSGAGVFGLDGRLVGLVSAGSPDCGVVLAVPGTVVRRFLDTHGVP